MIECEDKDDYSEQIIDNQRISKELKIENFISHRQSYFYSENDDEKNDIQIILASGVFSTGFHILLIVMIVTGEIYPYIFPVVLIFICACISTWKVFPFYLFSISTINVIDHLKKIINAKVILNDNIPIPAKYVVDVTGKIDIPKNIYL